ncbi:MAG: STAS domain-containing protein [Actinomycetota bacterium]|nr:STAS domain-containing protein [Actinomycetota bacterium]
MDEQSLGPELVVTTTAEGDRTVVSIKGEIDAYTAPGLEERIASLVSDGANDIVLDLSETGFIDSSGLRAILTSQRRLRDGNGELRLRNASEPVTRLLDISGLAEHFTTE